MKRLFHPELLNGPFGDPALLVDMQFERRALLLDMGDMPTCPTRKILRITHAFVSHAHMDHFMGLDRIVRLCLGRDRALHIFGPPGLIDQVGHRLTGYTWNLVESYPTEFNVTVTEFDGGPRSPSARFGTVTGFAREPRPDRDTPDGVLLEEDAFRIRAVVLDHRTPCLAFALEERQHVNVWKDRLDALGLPTGPWLRELKHAVLRGDPDDTPIPVPPARGQTPDRGSMLPLGRLKAEVLHLAPGQKIGYVVDAVYSPENARRIVALVRDADVLFIESPFMEAEAAQAAAKYHLTTRQAGALARAADVKHLVPFHFSPRYADREHAVRREVAQAFGAEPETPVTGPARARPGG